MKTNVAYKLKVIQNYDPGDGPGPCVHTFLGSGAVMLGAHWKLSEIEKLIDEFPVKRSGPNMQAMNHGVVVFTPSGSLFLETEAEGKGE